MKWLFFSAMALGYAAAFSAPANALPSCEIMIEPLAGDECMHNGRRCRVLRGAVTQETLHIACQRPKATKRKRYRKRRRNRRR